MDEDGEDFTPFWDQSSTNRRRGRRLSPSSCLNSGVLIFFLCIAAIIFLFFVIPSVLSLTSQIFRPNLVKKSWDSINVVLVLFALLFGFLSRNLNYDSNYSDQFVSRNDAQKSNPTTPQRWYEYSDRTAFSSAPAAVGGLRRTYSSHPDLREASSWDAADERWRFFDDTQVESYRTLDSDGLPRRRSWKRVVEEEDGDREGSYYSKTIHVDKMVTRAEEVPPPPPSPPPQEPEAEAAPPSPPPAQPIIYHKPRRSYESIAHSEAIYEEKRDQPKTLEPVTSPAQAPHSVRRKHKRAYESVGRREKRNGQVADEPELEMSSAPIPPPPPQSLPHSVRRRPKRIYENVIPEDTVQVEKEPELQAEAPSPPSPGPLSPPPTPPPAQLSPPPTISEKKGSTSERKKGTATKDFLLHFQRKKKKKQRQKTVENIGALFEPEPSSSFPPPSPPPPPPPPPPPSSVFNNFFSSKKGKGKKFLSVPPPPPPPPRNSITVARASKSTAESSQISSGKPPLPVKTRSFSNDENSNSGGESPMTGYGSPLNRIPPPPPPPPFKMPSWKFMVHGDYVRVGSVNSSRSVSPDLEDEESPRSDVSSEVGAAEDGGEVAAPSLFCSSPDVDTKADMFIAKFRAGLKVQKINSMKQKQGLGLSNLGPEAKPRPGPRQI